MFCPKCGTEIQSDGSFCMNCGQKIKKNDTPKPISINRSTNRKVLYIIIGVLLLICGGIAIYSYNNNVFGNSQQTAATFGMDSNETASIDPSLGKSGQVNTTNNQNNMPYNQPTTTETSADPTNSNEEGGNPQYQAKGTYTGIDSLKQYLPSASYQIMSNVPFDIDKDGVNEIAITAVDWPRTMAQPRDSRYYVFRIKDGVVLVLGTGHNPGAIGCTVSTINVRSKSLFVLNGYFGGDGEPNTLALTYTNGKVVPIWHGNWFADVDNDGVLEGLSGFKGKVSDVFQWNEARGVFVNSKGETTEYPLNRP